MIGLGAYILCRPSKKKRMRIILTLTLTIGTLTGASAQSDIEQEAFQLATELQAKWKHCLGESYRITRTQTPNRNAAAEMAFQSCATEENSLHALNAQFGVNPQLLANLRYRIKQTLMGLP